MKDYIAVRYLCDPLNLEYREHHENRGFILNSIILTTLKMIYLYITESVNAILLWKTIFYRQLDFKH